MTVNQKQIVFIDNEDKATDFIINIDYLFIWTKHVIRYYPLGQEFTPESMKEVQFKIDPESTQNSISQVMTGSNPSLIVIIASQKKSNDTVFTWDVANNIERESYDVGTDYEIIWDRNGNPYII